MPTIRFMKSDGTATDVEADVGDTVMAAAVNNMVPGILAECGGVCACATCHVFVDEHSLAMAGAIGEFESAMLQGTAVEATSQSRLACQLTVKHDWGEFVVHLPDRQI